MLKKDEKFPDIDDTYMGWLASASVRIIMESPEYWTMVVRELRKYYAKRQDGLIKG